MLLITGRHDAGDGFQINVLPDLLGLDVLLLVRDEHEAPVGLPTVLVDPLVHRILVHKPEEVAKGLLLRMNKVILNELYYQ